MGFFNMGLVEVVHGEKWPWGLTGCGGCRYRGYGVCGLAVSCAVRMVIVPVAAVRVLS